MPSSPSEKDKWIRCFHPSSESEVRLVCFPHAGGAASAYFSLSRALPPEIQVLAVQYPGRQDRRREPCADNLLELADLIFQTLSSRGDQPFTFFGHSMGAVLAYEVARRFEQRLGKGPRWLFVSGRRAPSRYRNESVHLRDDSGVIAEMRRLGGTDQRFLDDEELLAATLPMVRKDYEAIETYEWMPGPPLHCPITALVGDSDPRTTIDEASAWGEHAAEDFELRVFPGGHFFLDANQAEVVKTIAAALSGKPHVDSYQGNQGKAS